MVEGVQDGLVPTPVFLRRQLERDAVGALSQVARGHIITRVGLMGHLGMQDQYRAKLLSDARGLVVPGPGVPFD